VVQRDGISCSNAATGGPGGGPKWQAAKFLLAEEADIFLRMAYISKLTKEEKRWVDRSNGGATSPAQALVEAPSHLDLGAILSSAVPAISEWSPSQLNRVVNTMSITTFENRENLLVEGEHGGELFVLLTGEVQVAILGRVIRNLSTPGVVLGEKALQNEGHTIGATVTAVNGPVTVMRLTKQDARSVQEVGTDSASDGDGGENASAISLLPLSADTNGAKASMTVVPPTAGADGPRGDPIRDFHWHESKWEERAARTTLNAAGGYDGSLDHPGFGAEPGPDFRCELSFTCCIAFAGFLALERAASLARPALIVWLCVCAYASRLPTESLSDPYIDNFIAAHQQLHDDWVGTGTQLENVLMVITRTRNHNCVVYRANMVSDTGKCRSHSVVVEKGRGCLKACLCVQRGTWTILSTCSGLVRFGCVHKCCLC
jgi:hypothetical protein